MKLPDAYSARIARQLGDAAQAYFAALDEPYQRGLRLNPLKPAPLSFAVGDAIPWAKNAYYLPNTSDAGARIEHQAGQYYIQEPSAMAAAETLLVRPGERVLDLCAAPGGKTTQLALQMAGRGVIVANEPNALRAQTLSSNVERMGIQNAVVVSAMPEALCARWAGWFDKVLVDAPCSGEGMFRRHPETVLEWSEAMAAGCAQRQKGILECAAQMLRPGGRLAYSTCTFNPEEDARQIEAFLSEHPSFSPVAFSLSGLPEAREGMLQLWPHQIRGEGHFVALLQKDGDAPGRADAARLLMPAKDEEALCRAFFDCDMTAQPPRVAQFMGGMVCPPEEVPPIDGIKVLRLGLSLGRAKGRVFAPDHALSMAVPFRRQLPLSEKDALLYLHGEELPADAQARGYAAVTYHGLQLGIGKVSDGRLKNHYPKGLRR